MALPTITYAEMTHPQVETGSVTVTPANVRGFRFARVVLYLGVNSELAKLTLRESDDQSNWTVLVDAATAQNIDGKLFPLGANAQPLIVAFEVDLKGRALYLDLDVNTGTPTGVAIWAELDRAERRPSSGADFGAASLWRV